MSKASPNRWSRSAAHAHLRAAAFAAVERLEERRLMSTVVYEEDFQSGSAADWSGSSVSTAPTWSLQTGEKYYGPSQNGSATLTLDDDILDPHKSYQLSFDLYTLNGWGEGSGSHFEVETKNSDESTSAYASQIDQDVVSPGTGLGRDTVIAGVPQSGTAPAESIHFDDAEVVVMELNGSVYCAHNPSDSVERFTLQFTHTDGTDKNVRFTGSGLSDPRKWGIDNVKVEEIPPPEATCCCGAFDYGNGTQDVTSLGLGSGGFGGGGGPGGPTVGAGGASGGGPGGVGVRGGTDTSLILQGDGSVILTGGGTPTWFDNVSGTLVERFGGHNTLAYDSGNGEYRLAGADGSVTRFYDFGYETGLRIRGKVKAASDPGGNMTNYAYNGSGQLTEVTRQDVSAAGTTTKEYFTYGYIPAGETNAGRVSRLMLRRKTWTSGQTEAGVGFTNVRTADYQYFDGTLAGTHAGGIKGNLRAAAVSDPAAGKSVSSVSYNSVTGLATVTSTGHDYANGDVVVLAGANEEEFNGVFVVSGVTTNTFAVAASSTAPASATGTVTVNKPLETAAYRYYTASSGTGYAGGLKYALGAASFERARGAAVDPFTGDVSAYADNYFEYDSSRRVTKNVAQGEGCSSCAGGLGQFTYAYTTSPNTDPNPGSLDYDVWKTKTVETLPDGNTKTFYLNEAGQVMLEVFQEGSNKWGSFYAYDAAGRTVMTAEPSAVALPSSLSTLEGYTDLLHKVSGNHLYLSESQGLIRTTEYGTLTTADSSTAGDVAGYYKGSSLRRGESGAPVPQGQTLYVSKTEGAVTVYPVASNTVYSTYDGTSGQATTYAYTWRPGTTRVESETVTRPEVTEPNNGPGSATSEVTFYDAFGRPTWTKDAGGFMTRTTYDAGTGSVTEFITDVNTGTTTDEPSGWTTPSGGGLHLVTAMEVDGLGRVTKTTDPNGNDGDANTPAGVTYTVYNDADYEVRVYPGWDAAAKAPTGPVRVHRQDRGRKYDETLSMTYSYVGGTAPSVPVGNEPLTGLQSLSRTHYNVAGQVEKVEGYYDLTGVSYATTATLGTLNTNYYRTEYAYDQRGRQKRVKDADGTITWTLYDGLGRPTSTWVGTDDTGAVNGDPDGSGGANNMRKVGEREYDGGGVGDSNLTKSTALPGGTAAARVTEYAYDWRDRLVATKAGVQTGESTADAVQRQVTWCKLDNLGRQVECYVYDGDGLGITADVNTDGVPDQPASGLHAKRTTAYDEQGRVYRTDTYSVVSGTAGNSVRSYMWYDQRGNVLKSAAAGGPVAKYQYDGAGRAIKSFVTDGGGDVAAAVTGNWLDADDVTGDKVLEQSQSTYDANGNVTLVTARQRFHDEAATGELGDDATAPKARVSYQAFYYDAAGRTTAAVDVGTNGGSSYTRPGSAPSRSDTVLVTNTSYDDANRRVDTTDPRGIVGRTEYDLLGRTTKAVEAYVDGTAHGTDNAVDRITLYTYNGNGRVVTLTADLPSGQSDQTTQYVYGSSLSLGLHDVARNDLLIEVRYPDKATGAAGTAQTDKQQYRYNALGEARTYIDQNGTTHTYAYDVLGRRLADDVGTGTLPSGVDGAVRKLAFTYDPAGRLEKATSYDSSGSTVNQVQWAYNGLGQLTTEYQDHDGAVFTSTSPKVQYAYDTTAASGVFTKGSRPTGMTSPASTIDPTGRVLRYEYSSGVDDTIGRLSYLADDDSGAVSQHLEEYSYLGLGTVVEQNRPEPDVKLTYAMQGSESVVTTGTGAGDRYTGLDRFGRVVGQRWYDGDATGGASTDAAYHTDRFLYGYDRNSNVLSRDVTGANAPTDKDEAYTYDSLNRLTKMNRGTLASGTIADAAANYTRRWDGVGVSGGKGLDALGNWQDVIEDPTGGDNSYTKADRTHDSRNELTAVAGTSLAYSSNGEMTSDETGQDYKYDAWGRTVAVDVTKNADYDDGTDRGYAYDAVGRRILEGPKAGGDPTDLYHSAGWQVIEERVDGVVTAQNVWSTVYIDALVLRDQPASPDGQLDVDATGYTGFSVDGKLTTDIGTGTTDSARAVAVDSQGRLVVAGSSGNDFAIARYEPDGDLDPTFDGPDLMNPGNGKFVVNFNSSAADTVWAVAVDSSDRVVLVGDSNGDFAAARLTTTGALDTAFDTDGKQTVDFGGSDGAFAVAIQPADGKIVLAGNNAAKFALARLNTDGSLDSGVAGDLNTADKFGPAGKVTTDLTGSFETAYAVAVQPDGAIVAAGFSSPTSSLSNADFAAARYEPDGDLDTTFGTGGKAAVEFSATLSGSTERSFALAVQPDGAVLMGGFTNVGGTNDFALARLTAAGAADTSFDGDGKLTTNFGSADQCRALVLQADGKIVAAGTSNGDFVLARYYADGTLDPTFDADGQLTTNVGGTDAAYGVAMDRAGRIVAVGESGGDFAVVAYGGDGRTVRTYAQQDANFNTTALTDKAGVVLERYRYDPYGQVIVLNADWSTDADNAADHAMPFLHQGGRLEAATGLYQFRRRDYSPSLGRWTSQDPAEYVDGMNLYGYVRSYPVGHVDPLGLGTYRLGNEPPPDSYDDAIAASAATYNTASYFGSLHTILSIRSRAFAGIAAGLIFSPHAARALNHFLRQVDTPHEIDAVALIDQDFPSLTAYQAELVDAMRYVEANFEAIAAADGQIVTEADYPVTTTINTDWGNTLGGYRYYAIGKFVHKEGDTYCMKWGYSVRDLYDWDITSTAGISFLGQTYIQDAELARLHRWGWAQEMTISGFYDVKVQWKKGDTFAKARVEPLTEEDSW